MKRYLLFIMATAIFTNISVKVHSQNSGAFFNIDKANFKIICDTAKVQKTLNVEIGGFETKQQLDDFVNKFKTLRGVVSIAVVDGIIDNKYKAVVVLYKYAGLRYFQNLLKWADIKYIYVDNVKYETAIVPSIKID